MPSTTELLYQWGPHRDPHGPMGPSHPVDPHWGGGMMPWGPTGGAGVSPLWSLLWLGLLLAVVVISVVLVRNYLSQQEAGSRTDPVEILRERYARGDIDEAEFEERRRRLTGDSAS